MSFAIRKQIEMKVKVTKVESPTPLKRGVIMSSVHFLIFAVRVYFMNILKQTIIRKEYMTLIVRKMIKYIQYSR